MKPIIGMWIIFCLMMAAQAHADLTLEQMRMLDKRCPGAVSPDMGKLRAVTECMIDLVRAGPAQTVYGIQGMVPPGLPPGGGIGGGGKPPSKPFETETEMDALMMLRGAGCRGSKCGTPPSAGNPQNAAPAQFRPPNLAVGRGSVVGKDGMYESTAIACPTCGAAARVTRGPEGHARVSTSPNEYVGAQIDFGNKAGDPVASAMATEEAISALATDLSRRQSSMRPAGGRSPVRMEAEDMGAMMTRASGCPGGKCENARIGTGVAQSPQGPIYTSSRVFCPDCKGRAGVTTGTDGYRREAITPKNGRKLQTINKRPVDQEAVDNADIDATSDAMFQGLFGRSPDRRSE